MVLGDVFWGRLVLINHFQLIIDAQSGDKDAFAQLVELYQKRVFGLAVHLTGNHEDAQDLAQESFIRAYRTIKSFRLESDFGTWIHRITVNTWLNIKRKHKAIVLESLDQPHEYDSGLLKREVAATVGDPVQDFENRELRSLVQQILMEMSAEHRAVLVLREIYGYSYEEIALSTQTSVGTVKSRINRAKGSFKEKLIKLAQKTGITLFLPVNKSEE